MKKHYKQAIFFAGFLFSGAAVAATETTTINVTASVTGSCTVSADPISFGDVVEFTEVSTSGDVTVNCSTGTSYLVGMDQGQHFVSPFRRMENPGGDPINYVILKTIGQELWGDNAIAGGNFNASPVGGTGTGADQAISFDAKANGPGLGSGENVLTEGTTYSDVVTVTVQF